MITKSLVNLKYTNIRFRCIFVLQKLLTFFQQSYQCIYVFWQKLEI